MTSYKRGLFDGPSAAAVLLGLGLLGWGGAAAAQAPAAAGSPAAVGEVIVTARRVSEAVQDVPIPVSVVDSRQIEANRIFTPESLNNIVPNVKVFKTVTNSNSFAIFIRGVGRDNNFFNVESPVALYVDDVLYPYQVGAVVDLGGVDRIEVLRGPQGTLYGRNATVGAVKYVSKHPDLQSLQASYNLTAGSYQRYEASGSVSVPLIADKLAVKLDLGYHYYGGYMYDLAEHTKLDGLNGGSGRLSLLYRPKDNIDIYVAGDYTRSRDEPNISTLINLTTRPPVPAFGSPYVGSHSGPDLNNLDAGGLTVQGTWRLDAVTLRSISAFRGIKQIYSGDVFSGTQPSNVYFNDARDQTFTQEFQATGDAIGGRLKYVGGLFYMHSRMTTFLRRTGASNTKQVSQSVAGYADGTFDLTHQLSISGGARYTRDSKDVVQTIFRPPSTQFAVQASKDWGAATYRVGADYKITPDLMVYSSWGEGFKSGQLNSLEPATPAAAGVFVPPERDKNTEVGIKSEWLDHRLRLNVNYFWTDYTNMTTAIQSAGLTLLVTNDARIRGLEFELAARPLPGWTIGLNGGTLHAKYVNVQPGSPAGLSPDRTLKHAPKFMYNLSTQYEFGSPGSGGRILLGADYSYMDSMYESIVKSALTFEKPTHVLNLNAAYLFPGDHYRIVLAGTNVTGEKYFKVVSNPNVRFYAAPAELSVTLKYNY